MLFVCHQCRATAFRLSFDVERDHMGECVLCGRACRIKQAHSSAALAGVELMRPTVAAAWSSFLDVVDQLLASELADGERRIATVPIGEASVPYLDKTPQDPPLCGVDAAARVRLQFPLALKEAPS